MQQRVCINTALVGHSDCESKDEWFVSGTTPLENAVESDRIWLRKPSKNLHMAMDPRIPDEYEYFEFALAENFQVIRGTVESGDLSSMELSDDQRLEVKLGFTLANTEPPVWLELESVLDNQIPESLSIQIESSVTSLGVDQRVEFFNFDTNTYELLSVDSTNLLDQTMTISGTGDISRFVELGTGNVKTRIGFKADGLITAFPWTAKIDRFFWAAGN